MYAKLFAQVVASSLTQNETIDVRGVFFMLLAVADREGHVAGVDASIARIINVPMEVFGRALERLMQPDPESQSQMLEGRRVVRLEGKTGLWIVNYEKYQGILNDEQRRAYFRQKKAEQRAREAGLTEEVVPGEPTDNGSMPPPMKRTRSGNRPRSLQEVIEAGAMDGLSAVACEKFWNWYEGFATKNENGETIWMGGKDSGKVVGNWRKLLSIWKANDEEKKAKDKASHRGLKEAQRETAGGPVPMPPIQQYYNLPKAHNK
jgi:hypothetical protein